MVDEVLNLVAVAVTANDFATRLPVLEPLVDKNLVTSFVLLPAQQREEIYHQLSHFTTELLYNILMFNILKVRINVDIVSVVDYSDVATRGHVLKAVSTQELDAGGGVLTPPRLLFIGFFFPAFECLLLYLSYLK